MTDGIPGVGSSSPAWRSETDGEGPSPEGRTGSGTPPARDAATGYLAGLTAPVLAPPKLGGLSLESLVQAVGMEERNTVTASGMESVKAKAQQRSELHAARMEKIKVNLALMESKNTANGFLNAFKKVGMVLGAVAAVASLAVGVATGNQLIIAGGIILAGMAVNGILDAATDGKVSISSGVGALAKTFGASDTAAHWIGFAVEGLITLAGCALSIGGAIKGSQAIAQLLSSTGVVNKILVGSNIASTALGSANTIATGVTQGIIASYDYKITNTLADQKDLAAVLERIRQAIEMDQDFLETIMERSSDLLAKVGEIVNENTEAQTAILGGTSPSMA